MSNYELALIGAQAVVLALPLFASYTSAQSDIRQRPFASQADGDVFPFLCFSPTVEVPGKTFRASPDAAGVVGMAYPVVCSFFYQKTGYLADENALAWMYGAREAIRHALWQPHALGVPGQVDCDYDPDPAVDLGALDSLILVSVQLFTALVAEIR